MLHAIGHILWILFGPSTWGAGGNMAAWIICGMLTMGLGLLFRKRLIPWMQELWRKHASNGWADEIDSLRAHLSGELAEHVASLKAHADKHAQQALDRQDVHAAATQAHVTAAVATVTPPQPPPVPRPRAPKNDAVA